MSFIIYTVGQGLYQVNNLDEVPYHELNAGGTYARGVLTAPLRAGWFKRIYISETLQDPYWMWEPVQVKDLPKRLRLLALIQDIQL